MPRFSNIAELTQHRPSTRCTNSASVSWFHFTHLSVLHYRHCLTVLVIVRAVINETLRLFPPVPLNVRESRSAPCLLPPSDSSYYSKSQTPQQTPFFVPGNTLITYLPLLTQRNPALWGPDADEFKPERWLNPEMQAKCNSNMGMFMPFSHGPRIVRRLASFVSLPLPYLTDTNGIFIVFMQCIGKNYAYNEMTFFLVRLLQQFDRFELALECQPEGSLPPPEWKGRKGRQTFEKIWPAAALTLFIKVSS